MIDLVFAMALLGSPNAGGIPVQLEAQAWWKTDGHLHCAVRLPVGQVVSGNLHVDVRVLFHDNPATFERMRVDASPGITIWKSVKYNKPGGNNAYSVPIDIDTRDLPNGWQTLRFRATSRNRDGSLYLTSSEYPVFVDNAQPTGRFSGVHAHGSIKANDIMGKGWYDKPVDAYASVIIRGLPPTPVRGILNVNVTARDKSRLLVVEMDKGHAIQAVGPWASQPAQTGVTLTPSSTGNIRIDTTKLSNGSHSIQGRSDRGDGLQGVAKRWFVVQN